MIIKNSVKFHQNAFYYMRLVDTIKKFFLSV